MLRRGTPTRLRPSLPLRLMAPVIAVCAVHGLVANEAWALPSRPPLRAALANLSVQIRYKPVADAQIAIWLEDENGKFLADLFVTQSTGRLGIGNRPGHWNFLSSWRAPYGPRPSVLPIWAHRRKVTYPQIIFHDPNNIDSLGFHEATSSRETYHCRPLTESENEAIIDTMTCPSPQTFRSDKGRFDPDGGASVYPPRNDLVDFDEKHDHPDTKSFEAINDLDGITGATPTGEQIESLKLVIRDEILQKAQGKLVFWLEISREDDQNEHFSYTREGDHKVDERLAKYGVGYLGQPSVVYKVSFDPNDPAIAKATAYSGYGDWNGASGMLHPPDDKISDGSGTGAGRLLSFELDGENGRLFVTPANTGDDDDDNDDSGSTDTTGEDPSDCDDRQLPPFEQLNAQAKAFDRVALTFRVPQAIAKVEPTRIRAYYHVQFESTEFVPAQALEVANIPPLCEEMSSAACVELKPGGEVTLEVDQLWGNYNYAFAVSYDEVCGEKAELISAHALTPKQTFQQLESMCVVATASYGAAWAHEVAALRTLRDVVLRKSGVGTDLVRLYYAYGPALANLIAPSELARAEVRAWLQPLANASMTALWQSSASTSSNTNTSSNTSTSPNLDTK